MLVSFGTVKQGGIVAAVDIQIMVNAFRNHRDSYYFKIRTGEECAPAIKDNIEITNDFLQQPEILCNFSRLHAGGGCKKDNLKKRKDKI